MSHLYSLGISSTYAVYAIASAGSTGALGRLGSIATLTATSLDQNVSEAIDVTIAAASTIWSTSLIENIQTSCIDTKDITNAHTASTIAQ